MLKVSLFVTALQRHYAILQAIALDEDLGETRDETLPDKEGMNRLQQFFKRTLFQKNNKKCWDLISSERFFVLQTCSCKSNRRI